MGSAPRAGVVWTTDDRGDVVCGTRDRSRGSAWLRVLECCRNCQLTRSDRVLTCGEFRCCHHDDEHVGARVVSFTRAAKQTNVPRRVLRVRWFVAAGEGPRRDRDPVWRRGFVLRFKTRVAVASSGVEFLLGRAACDCSFSDLVWTSYLTTRLGLYRRVFHPAS